MNSDDDRDSTKKGTSGPPPATPYGPNPRGVDEAAGGADSSPLDNQPTDEAKDASADEKQKRKS